MNQHQLRTFIHLDLMQHFNTEAWGIAAMCRADDQEGSVICKTNWFLFIPDSYYKLINNNQTL